MRQSVRAWMAVAGTAAAVGAVVLGQPLAASARVASAGVPAGGFLAAGGSAAGQLPAAPVPGSAYVAGHRTLYLGMHGADVRALQRRLNFLHYYAGRADGTFGMSTLEAVWAFKEVQGGVAAPRNPNSVGPYTQRQLVHPRLPKILVRHGGWQRIEISKKIEVLVLYKNNKVALISHVSTGGGYYYCSPGGGCGNRAITPNGNYRALSFLPNWVKVPLGMMFNPVFFIGRAYAIHGDVPVPLAPVSHGCVRIPMDIANFFHGLVRLGSLHGTRIYIRGPLV